MALSTKSLAGPGYIILNIIRAMNIIGFLVVIAASVVMLVKTSTQSKFFFFDAVSHVVSAFTSTVLIVSELCLFPGYFERNWPLLSPEHGFVGLAMAMIILGLDILGNLNKTTDTQEALGLPFWRIVIGAGILIFILGFINLIASYVFRDRFQGITARMVRADGAVASQKTPRSMTMKTPTSQFYAPSTPKDTSPTTTCNPLRLITTRHSRTPSVLPSYHTAASPTSTAGSRSPISRPAASPTSRYSRATNCARKKIMNGFHMGGKRDSLPPPLPLNISAPMGVNPQFAHLVNVKRPDSALHPARGGEEPWRFKG